MTSVSAEYLTKSSRERIHVIKKPHVSHKPAHTVTVSYNEFPEDEDLYRPSLQLHGKPSKAMESLASARSARESRMMSFSTFNARLRHDDSESPRRIKTHRLNRLMRALFNSVLQDCLEAIQILSKINKLPPLNINLEYVPLTKKYDHFDLNIDRFYNEPWQIVMKKFEKDVGFITSALGAVISGMDTAHDFAELQRLLNNLKMTRDEETVFLMSKKFNQNEIVNLRVFGEEEKTQYLNEIQAITEDIGLLKDELNDDIAAYGVKMNYLNKWENSRGEQNKLVLDQKEAEYTNTIKNMALETEKEERIHEEMMAFLETSQKDYMDQIEEWMEKYDKEVEERETEENSLKIERERQKDTYVSLLIEYERRKIEIEKYLEHKMEMQKIAEELARRTRAATKIQAWWRGTMYRKCLGPYRKKKGKGNGKKGSAKNSGKKKK